MSAITPYKIAVPDADIQRLRSKLAATTFPQETDFTDNLAYGTSLSTVKRLVARWQDGYDWRATEARLNDAPPQFTTSVPVDGFGDIPLHFVHARSSRPDAIPLLFCHGWSGSFIEVIKILPLLTEPSDPAHPAFHVVAPSLPNFGFSPLVKQPGFSTPQHAEAQHALMHKLGYARYATQGGDWGFWISRQQTLRWPSDVLAAHLNFFYIMDPPTDLDPSTLTPAEQAGLARAKWFGDESGGYAFVNRTRPHSLGFALADSPAGWLGWLQEKLVEWTDDYPWTDDEVLDWVSIWVFSSAGPDAASRIYWEMIKGGPEDMRSMLERADHVPLGVSSFPKDVMVFPIDWAEQRFGPVVYRKVHERGGHFAAYEVPELLVGDLREMFGPGGGAEGVAKEFKGK